MLSHAANRGLILERFATEHDVGPSLTVNQIPTPWRQCETQLLEIGIHPQMCYLDKACRNVGFVAYQHGNQFGGKGRRTILIRVEVNPTLDTLLNVGV